MTWLLRLAGFNDANRTEAADTVAMGEAEEEQGNCEGGESEQRLERRQKMERCVYRRLKSRGWRKRYPLIGLYPNCGSHRHLNPWLCIFYALIWYTDIKILNKIIYDNFFSSKKTLSFGVNFFFLPQISLFSNKKN